MEFTYENVLKWFDIYFKDVYRYQGDLMTVPNLKKYFAPDFEFYMYTSPNRSPKTAVSREALLMTFVHPGLLEEIVPRYYVVDTNQMIVVVHFEINFSDKPSAQVWPPIGASAHYHLIQDENKDLKIRKIQYWTSPLPAEIMQLWAKRREEALTEYALNYIDQKP